MTEQAKLRALIAEEIAKAIEKEAQFEGPRAKRIIKMCAAVARHHKDDPAAQ